MLRGGADSVLDRADDRDARGARPSRLVTAGTVCAVLLGAMLLASVAIIVWSRTSSSSPTRHGGSAAGVGAGNRIGTCPSAVDQRGQGGVAHAHPGHLAAGRARWPAVQRHLRPEPRSMPASPAGLRTPRRAR